MQDEGRARLDTGMAHPARVYNYWLGGTDNFAADRAAAEQAVAANPDILRAVRANRAFLGRTVGYLAGQAGIRQFLDIGTGLPTADNTHEVAQRAAPASRVLYVDNDPVVPAYSRALLTSTPEGASRYLEADLREVDKILTAAASTLDLDRPVGLVLAAILQYIPDGDDPYGLVARLLERLAPGSHLVISHPASDIQAGKVAESMRRYNQRAAEHATPRTRADVCRFFAGLRLLDPGIVQIPYWRPGPDEEPDPSIFMWGGVGVTS